MYNLQVYNAEILKGYTGVCRIIINFQAIYLSALHHFCRNKINIFYFMPNAILDENNSQHI